jgi:hypothetical protein
LPVRVEVLDKSEHEPDVIGFPQKLKQKKTPVSLRRFRFPAVAAAAVILLGLGLFLFSTPTAKAIDLAQIRSALGRVRNIYIATFYQKKPDFPGEKSMPVQEQWVSKDLNAMVIKTGAEWVLWNINDRSKTTINADAASTESMKISKGMMAGLKENMYAPLNLPSLENNPDIRENMKWRQVTEKDINNKIPDTGVYELSWTVKDSIGSIVCRKRVFHVDTKTKLPFRIEFWQKSSADEEYELLTFKKVSYPAGVEIQAVLEEAGF